MKRLSEFTKGYRIQSALAPLFKLLEASFELLVPLVVASVIDRGIAGGDTGYVYRMSAVLLALGIVGFICAATAQYFSARAAVGFAKRLRHALFDKIRRFSFETLDRLGASTLMTRMSSDVTLVQSGVNLTLRLLLRSPFIVFGAVAMAFTVDAKSAVVFAAAVPLLAVVVVGVMLVTIPLYRKVQERMDRVARRVRENLSGVRVIRAFALERREKEEFERDNGSLKRLQVFVGRISALTSPLTFAIVNCATALLIYAGALRVNSGAITTGQVVALYNYMSQILIELIKFAAFVLALTKAVAGYRRIGAILDMPEDRRGGGGVPKGGRVEFKNAGFRYDGAGDTALEGVSFTVESGQTVGVIGGTGSGKSTLVNLIPGFYLPTEGSVTVGGVDTKDADPDALIRSVAVVPQRALLFSGTLRENLLYGGDADDETLMRALENAQALDVLSAKGGLDSRIEAGGKNLSGGQRQRLTIARALVKNADVLILDDSSSALDYATDAALRKALRSLPQTVFIVSQRTSAIRHADRIIVLDDGKPVGIGTHEELLESCDIYREIHFSQYEGGENA